MAPSSAFIVGVSAAAAALGYVLWKRMKSESAKDKAVQVDEHDETRLSFQLSVGESSSSPKQGAGATPTASGPAVTASPAASGPATTFSALRRLLLDALCLKCPSCGMAFAEYDGCPSVSCAGCGSKFCALCLSYTHSDTHSQWCAQVKVRVEEPLGSPLATAAQRIETIRAHAKGSAIAAALTTAAVGSLAAAEALASIRVQLIEAGLTEAVLLAYLPAKLLSRYRTLTLAEEGGGGVGRSIGAVKPKLG